MFFVSSILLGKDAMWTITRSSGYFFFGSHPWIVSIVVSAVVVLIVVHAVLATRKFPGNYRQPRHFVGTADDEPRRHHAGSGRSSPGSRCSFSRRFILHACPPDRIDPTPRTGFGAIISGRSILLLLAVSCMAASAFIAFASNGAGLGGDPNATRRRLSAEMGDHRFLSGAGLRNACGLYQDRHRPPGTPASVTFRRAASPVRHRGPGEVTRTQDIR